MTARDNRRNCLLCGQPIENGDAHLGNLVHRSCEIQEQARQHFHDEARAREHADESPDHQQ